ncbi:MAG TPA: hypothetical protein VFB04_09785, partial [Terriglobales bacterium]|nr:hypothetical protein [Terriglobales bacterium]
MTTWGHRRLVCMFAIAMSAVCLSQDSTAPPHNATPPPATIPNTIDCGAFAAGDPRLDLVSKLCTFALTYRQQLPDFIAQQTITARGAKSSTVMTEQVVFRQGREYYSQLNINGKAAQPGFPAELPRNVRFTSAGEFGSMLVDLFRTPGTTEFSFRRSATLQKVPVIVYEFHVPREKNSFWTVRDVGQTTILPEFQGELWLDRKTGHLLREKLEPVHLPSNWRVGSIKTVTDYAMTIVSGVGEF